MNIFEDIKHYIDSWLHFKKEFSMSQEPNQKCICCAGPVGPQGIPGVQGPQGNQGPRGEQGNDGPRGLPGPQGDKGDKGDKGDPGPMGPQGMTGQNGHDGKDGLDGPMGPMGPQGLQGEQGPKGDCVACPCECHVEWAKVYSQMNQSLSPSMGINLAGGSILFEKTIFNTAGIDLSNVGITGEIKVNKAGWYTVTKEICATLNPLSAPLIAFGIAIFVNGLLVPGSVFVDMTLSPDEQANETASTFAIHLNVGDIVKISNICTQTLLLNSFAAGTFGINAQSNSADLRLQSISLD